MPNGGKLRQAYFFLNVKKMNIKNLVENGGGNFLMISPAELKEFALALAEEVRTNARKELEDESGELFTPKEAAKKLGVTLTTLWRWQQKHYLDPIKIGAKVRYKERDVKRVLGFKVGGTEK